MNTKEFLRKQLEKEVLLYEKKLSDLDKCTFDEILTRWSDDSQMLEEHRYTLINILLSDTKNKKILDMAAGCGSFVIQGLLNGYDTYGVEPEDYKHQLIDIKFSENNYNPEWRNRIAKGVGEKLPFDNNTFDLIDSWQTIEHVANERECIFEFYRVLKKGGNCILRGPNYWCFHEGHYRMLWFPMLNPNSNFAKWYVGKIRKRPVEGLKTFHPVSPNRIKKHAKEAGFTIVNIKRKQIYDAAKRRIPLFKQKLFQPVLFSIYVLWDFYRLIKGFGLGQRTLSYLFTK